MASHLPETWLVLVEVGETRHPFRKSGTRRTNSKIMFYARLLSDAPTETILLTSNRPGVRFSPSLASGF